MRFCARWYFLPAKYGVKGDSFAGEAWAEADYLPAEAYHIQRVLLNGRPACSLRFLKSSRAAPAKNITNRAASDRRRFGCLCAHIWLVQLQFVSTNCRRSHKRLKEREVDYALAEFCGKRNVGATIRRLYALALYTARFPDLIVLHKALFATYESSEIQTSQI